MKKPVYFISSTVVDFKDLRSSIKWWLEENNYTVNASEFNDFDKPIDQNSYEACLKAIDNSDYFVLLLGERIGGMYDKDITITQMEYRYAYERMRIGKIKILNFIRQDTWTVFMKAKEQIKELEKTSETIPSINKLFSDKEMIRFKFIDEVRRVEEMKSGGKPKNNWLHQFNTFADIASVFKTELGNRFDLTFKQNRFIIINDIKANLKTICTKKSGAVLPIGLMSSTMWSDFQFDPDHMRIKLHQNHFSNYAAFYISCLQLKPFRTSRIDSFYKAGFFLEYDKDQNDFVSSSLNTMVLKLLAAYERVNSLHKSLYENSHEKLTAMGTTANNSHLTARSLDVFLALELSDELVNCIYLSQAIFKALKGLDYTVPILLDIRNRIPEKMRVKEQDKVTDDDVVSFLRS